MLSKYLRAPAVLAAVLLSNAASADYHVDILPPVTPVSHDIYDLHFGILWVCVAIFFVVFGAMFWSIFRHRKSLGAKAAQFHENTVIEIIWTIVPFVILIGMAYPATKTVLDMKDASNADISVKVTAYQWKWEYDYQQDGLKFLAHMSTPRDQIEEYGKKGPPKNENYLLETDNHMVVPVGKKVRLLITSNDVIHGWYVPQLGVNQYGIPGFIKDAWFTIEKAGIYRGQCSQICGKEHAFMPIVVEAVEPAKYAAWVSDMKAKMPASAPEAAPAATTAGGAPGPGATGASQAGATGGAQQVAAAAPGGAAPAKAADGKATYDTTCMACHSTGAAGAPKLGDKAAWAPRLKQGVAALHANAIKGKGAMPPKGGNTALPDDAVKAAVDYMTAAAK
ncbi:MAG TPA: cytochrome c oxidase subunit II [Usitatibacter sp.]|nr:cytochrome c oxidase subunit II [Usitatibacter sp.]